MDSAAGVGVGVGMGGGPCSQSPRFESLLCPFVHSLEMYSSQFCARLGDLRKAAILH